LFDQSPYCALERFHIRTHTLAVGMASREDRYTYDGSVLDVFNPRNAR